MTEIIQSFATNLYSICNSAANPIWVYYRYEVLSNKAKTFEELSEIDTERRFLNKRTRLGFFPMVVSLSGTVFMSLLFDVTFWLTIIIYFATRFYGGPTLNQLPGLGSTALSTGASLVTFALVFYVTQCYSRYCAQYDSAMAVEGRIFDLCLLCRACLSTDGSWRLYRYINAAHILGYAGLGSAYDANNLFLPLNQEYCLLTSWELDRLTCLGFSGGTCYREVLMWAMESVKLEYTHKHLSDFEMQQFFGQLVLLRSKMATLYDFADQPVPFSYVHFINYLLFLFLPIFAYTTAHSYTQQSSHSHFSHQMIRDSLVEGCSVFLFTSAALCLRTIGTRLQDPFGNNLEDLSVVHYCKFMLKASSKMLSASKFQCTTADEERKLFLARPSFGVEFEYDPCIIHARSENAKSENKRTESSHNKSTFGSSVSLLSSHSPSYTTHNDSNLGLNDTRNQGNVHDHMLGFGSLGLASRHNIINSSSTAALLSSADNLNTEAVSGNENGSVDGIELGSFISMFDSPAQYSSV